LFVHQTRLLSRYRYLIDGKPPEPVAVSNVEQHSGLAYYITLPSGVEKTEPDQSSGQLKAVSQQSLELRVSRYAGEGVHEDIDLTNFTRQRTSFLFELRSMPISPTRSRPKENDNSTARLSASGAVTAARAVTHPRVGDAVTSIRVYRGKDGASDYEVLDTRGPLDVIRQPSPWSLTAGLGERFKDALTSLLPGK
jgi:hypothetical protein